MRAKVCAPTRCPGRLAGQHERELVDNSARCSAALARVTAAVTAVHAGARGSAAVATDVENDLVGTIRDAMLARAMTCPHCGQRSHGYLRALSLASGIPAPTLSRWLNGGKLPNGHTLNQAVRYLCDLNPEAS